MSTGCGFCGGGSRQIGMVGGKLRAGNTHPHRKLKVGPNDGVFIEVRNRKLYISPGQLVLKAKADAAPTLRRKKPAAKKRPKKAAAKKKK